MNPARTPRQAYALANVVTDPYRINADPKLSKVRRHPRGFNILSILAVDR